MKTQQCLVLVSALVTVALGLLLVLIAKSLMAPDVLLRSAEPGFARAVLNLGAMACAVGGLGALGACASSRIALCLYGVCALATAVAGVVVGGSLLAAVNVHGEEINQACMVSQHHQQTGSELTNRYQLSYGSMKEALVNCRRNARPSAVGLQDCGQLGKDSQGVWFEEDPQRDVFAWLEEISGCGGFCLNDVALFGFPAVPGGPAVGQAGKRLPRVACFRRFTSELQARGDRAAALVLLLSLPLLFSVCGATWIICYPPPRTRQGYTHAGDVDDEDLAESDSLLNTGRTSDEEGGGSYVYPYR
mmetsp:Transcript_95675/g.205273  ORF Transcript_95675/g.205273 Transcript_95675/m.205273 type:complete len:304 (+) Transcript_95675:163-1074(+)